MKVGRLLKEMIHKIPVFARQRQDVIDSEEQVRAIELTLALLKMRKKTIYVSQVYGDPHSDRAGGHEPYKQDRSSQRDRP